MSALPLGTGPLGAETGTAHKAIGLIISVVTKPTFCPFTPGVLAGSIKPIRTKRIKGLPLGERPLGTEMIIIQRHMASMD